MPTLAIQIQSLTKKYGSVRALRGVDLEVRQGEIFGFLGLNGAGKTTTIRCMLDLIRPNGGSLRVLGLDPQEQSVEFGPGRVTCPASLPSKHAWLIFLRRDIRVSGEGNWRIFSFKKTRVSE